MPQGVVPAFTLDREPHNGTPATACYTDAEGTWGGQVAVIRAAQAYRFVLALFGRSAGKSGTPLFCLFAEGARCQGVYEVAYSTPYIAQAQNVYRTWKRVLAPLLTDSMGLQDGHDDARRILHLRGIGPRCTGVVIDFWGLENHDAHRGARKHRIFLDEVKDVLAEAVFNTLEPMLLGRARPGFGGILALGTPGRFGVGAAWVKVAFQRGMARMDGYCSLQAPSHCNPHLTEQEIADLIRRCPDAKAVQEEIYAQILEAEGAVFPNLAATFTIEPIRQEGSLWIGEDPDQGIPRDAAGQGGRERDVYAIGFDVGFERAASVASVFNRRTRRQAALLRMVKAPQDEQRRQVEALRARYNDATVIYDDTGGWGRAATGDAARNAQRGYSGKTWTQAQKESDIAWARFLCERGGTSEGWQLLNVPIQRLEFESYQAVVETSRHELLRRPKYGPPPGMTADTVSAACLIAEVLATPYVPAALPPGPPAFGTFDWFMQRRKGSGQPGTLRSVTQNVQGAYPRRFRGRL